MDINQRPVSVRIRGLKKQYRLGKIGYGSLKKDLSSWLAVKRGRTDPNARIGKKHINGETLNALDGIDLTIYKGERIGIIGKNGAGKSTLLKILCQITSPTEGDVELWGRITSMLEVGTGFNGEMTGRENIYQNGAILGMSRQEIDQKIDSIIEFSEVGDFIDTPIKRYSSGMFIKLGFAVASHLNSEIVIMDEVLAVGDMAFQNKCLTKMEMLSREDDRTILYVSHNMATVRRLCDRVIVLEDGRVIYDGDVEGGIEVYTHSHVKNDRLHYDFSDITGKMTAPEKLKGKLISLDILDKEILQYKRGEDVSFRIRIKAREPFDDMRLRLIVGVAAGNLVGAAPDLPLGKFDADETREFIVRFNTGLLTRGSYEMNVILCENHEYGVSINFDTLLPAFLFDIADDGITEWNSGGWGRIYFSDADVTSSK